MRFYYEFRRLRRLDSNIIVFVKYGLLYDIMLNLYRPFAVKFLTRLGGEEFHISLFNSVPGIVAVFALIPGALFLSRFKSLKRVTAMLFAMSRIVLLLFLFTPFFPAHITPWLFVCLIGALNFPDSISQSALQSYLGDVFDNNTRGAAISARSKFGAIVVLIVTLATGLIIGFVPQTDGQTIIFYQIFFALAFTVGVFEILTFLKFKPRQKVDSITPAVEAETVSTCFKLVFANKKFVKFLILTVLFHVTWHAGWPLGSIIQIIELGANEVWLAIFAVVSAIAGFMTANLWNKLSQKKGSSFAFTAAAFMVASNALIISVAPNNWFLIITFVIGGAAGIGTTMSLLNGLLETTPDNGRIFYFGVYNTFINISLAVSPFIAHFLITRFDSSRVALAIVGSGRFVTAGLLFIFFVLPSWKKRKTVSK